MGKRRLARERAVQFLFQHELNPAADLELAIELFWETQRLAGLDQKQHQARWGQPVSLPPPSAEEAGVRLFADELIRGTLQHWDAIDAEIKKYAQNWDLPRMAVVDRNIIRLAIYEMLFRPDIPPVVSINEAVDIAKKYSTQDSGRFVNGVLDQFRAALLRPARTGSETK
jgi:transcription antitermination protein NusB